MLNILVLNGPNMNRLGVRETGVYGTVTLTEIERRLRQAAAGLSVSLCVFQSNSEGALIEAIHDAADWADGILINPAAFGHYSYALHDALASVPVPALEVHLSNIYARDAWRRRSVLADVVLGTVCGLGWRSYLCGLQGLVGWIEDSRSERRRESVQERSRPGGPARARRRTPPRRKAR